MLNKYVYHRRYTTWPVGETVMPITFVYGQNVQIIQIQTDIYSLKNEELSKHVTDGWGWYSSRNHLSHLAGYKTRDLSFER